MKLDTLLRIAALLLRLFSWLTLALACVQALFGTAMLGAAKLLLPHSADLHPEPWRGLLANLPSFQVQLVLFPFWLIGAFLSYFILRNLAALCDAFREARAVPAEDTVANLKRTGAWLFLCFVTDLVSRVGWVAAVGQPVSARLAPAGAVGGQLVELLWPYFNGTSSLLLGVLLLLLARHFDEKLRLDREVAAIPTGLLRDESSLVL